MVVGQEHVTARRHRCSEVDSVGCLKPVLRPNLSGAVYDLARQGNDFCHCSLEIIVEVLEQVGIAPPQGFNTTCVTVRSSVSVPVTI